MYIIHSNSNSNSRSTPSTIIVLLLLATTTTMIVIIVVEGCKFLRYCICFFDFYDIVINIGVNCDFSLK